MGEMGIIWSDKTYKHWSYHNNDAKRIRIRYYKILREHSKSFQVSPTMVQGVIVVKITPFLPCNISKKLLWLPARVGLLLNAWHKWNSNIIAGLEIKAFAKVYVNLELSVNETFVSYGTMIKIFATLKSSYAKACYLR